MTKELMSEAKTGFVEKSAQTGGPLDEVKPLPKSRKITKKDWSKVQDHLKQELEDRKRNEFRVMHEPIWREVDRQIQMQTMVKVGRDQQVIPPGWHNVVELGELSKASENMSADVRRMVFPPSREWFDAHCDITPYIPHDDMGEKVPDTKLQQGVDGRLRAMMEQQHEDFGLKGRMELSIKEALHHGGFVAEVCEDTQEMVYEGTKTKTKMAPVWVPHSMWNCYPDPSPSVIGTNMFYEGTMFIESYKPRHKAEQDIKSGDEGWMPTQWKKVSKDQHTVKAGDQTEKVKDVKILTYWGDISIERDDETMYYPNHKAVLFNGTIVYFAPNDTPYPPIIYKGYERVDVRDPYFMSPIIKMSPMQKLSSQLANKFMDGVELSLEPPIVYDGNDPDFVLNGGPTIAPGSKVSSKGSSAFQAIQIGDVGAALSGMEFCLNEMKEKLGRPGKPVGDRATKAEVVKSQQDQEVSLIDFIDKVEESLRTYLYMQHVFNKRDLKEYVYYSDEMLDPDFLRCKGSDIPADVIFEVVGSRGVLGEQERNEKMTAVTLFAIKVPQFAGLLKPTELLLEMYQDAGVKNPERFIHTAAGEDPAALKAQVEQSKQVIQKLGGALQEEKKGTAVKMAKIQADAQAKHEATVAKHEAEMAKLATTVQIQGDKIAAEMKQAVMEMIAGGVEQTRNIVHEHLLQNKDHAHQIAQTAAQPAVEQSMPQ